ncbi:MAG: hypothetical protein AAFP26_08330, partial [Planctomycetota bacterium]
MPHALARPIVAEVGVAGLNAVADRAMAGLGGATEPDAVGAVLALAYRLAWSWSSVSDMCEPACDDLSPAALTPKRKCAILCGDVFAAYLVANAPVPQLRRALRRSAESIELADDDAAESSANSSEHLWMCAVDPVGFPTEWRGRRRNLADAQTIALSLRHLASAVPRHRRAGAVRALLRLRGFASQLVVGEFSSDEDDAERVRGLVFDFLRRRASTRALWCRLVVARARSAAVDGLDRKFLKLAHLRQPSSWSSWQRELHLVVSSPARRVVSRVRRFARDNLDPTPSGRRGSESADEATTVRAATRVAFKSLRREILSLDETSCRLFAEFDRALDAPPAVYPPTFAACALVRATYFALDDVTGDDVAQRRVLKRVGEAIAYAKFDPADEKLAADHLAFVETSRAVAADELNIATLRSPDDDEDDVSEEEDDDDGVSNALADVVTEKAADICARLGVEYQPLPDFTGQCFEPFV